MHVEKERNIRQSSKIYIGGNTYFSGCVAQNDLLTLQQRAIHSTIMAAPDLTAIVRELAESERKLRDIEKDIVGIEIAVNDLKTKMQKINKAAKSTEDEKREAQEAYVQEHGKLQELLREQETMEIKVVDLRRQKLTHLAVIKTEEDEARANNNTYEVLAPRDTNMQGSVINQIPEYNGTFGAEAESFVKLINRTKDQYNWQTRATAYMVRSKLTGAARIFIDNQEREMLPGLDEWDGPVPGGQNLRQMVLGKFSMPTTAAAATSAVEELKQETQETMDSFYERTRFAVDKLLFSVAKTTPEEKQMYQNLFQTQVYIFFKAGLLPNYRTKIFSAAGNQIPTTAVALLEAARNAEREVNTGKKLLLPKEIFNIEGCNVDKHTDANNQTADAESSISGTRTNSLLDVSTLKLQIEELQRQF